MNTTKLIFATNRVADVERCFLGELKGLYPDNEIRSLFLMLCEAFLGWDKVAYLLHRGETINQSDLLRFHWALEDLRCFRPIQHIVGYADFCGCRIKVNDNVLIPRPETEEMVEYILSRGQWSVVSILDLCTGSGCIAIALKKKLPQGKVTAVDISPKALEVARENAMENGVEVNFECGDVLMCECATTTASSIYKLTQSHNHAIRQWDLIIANPPYVTESEKAAMSRNVLEYDPPLALFVPNSDPLLFYRHIVAFAKEHLSAHGRLAMEINERFGKETLQLLAENGFAGELHKDFRGKDRFVTAALSSP
jgi:release factor glutamine methyltransferase